MPAELIVRDRVLEVRLRGRNDHNPLDHVTYVEAARALQSLDGRPELSVGLLRGAGERHFCVGGDMQEIAQAGDAAAQDPAAGARAALEALWFPVVDGADSSRPAHWFREHAANYRHRTFTPVVSAVQGQCLGAGLILMVLHSRIRVAGVGARFGLAEIKLGMAGGLALSGLAEVIAPRGVALLLTGDSVDAETALAIGLVTHVVPDAEVFDRAEALAQRIAGRPRLASLAEWRGLPSPRTQTGRAHHGALLAATRRTAETFGVGDD